MHATILAEKSAKQPTGLWIIAIATALFTFGFGMINSLLILYATGTFNIPSGTAYTLSATYNSLLFTLPLIGGYVAEKLGYKKAAILGIILNTLALIFLTFHKITMLYLGLSTFSVGVSFYVPAYLVLQGRLYAKDDKRRESGFTLSYIIMNVGFLVSIVLGGYIARYLGYSWAFAISAVIAALSALVFLLGRKYIKPGVNQSFSPELNWSKFNSWLVMIAVSLGVIALSAWLLANAKISNGLLFALIIVATIFIIITAMRHQDKLVKHKLFAFIILSYISIGFWALYMLEPSLVTVFIEHNVNRHFFSGQLPASSFYSLDAFFIIAFGGAFGFLWTYLAKKKRNPSLPTKFTLSLFVMGSGFLILLAGIYFADALGFSSMLWIVLAYILFAVAELLISPIGQSMVGLLSPPKMEGSLMGLWQVFTGFAGVISGYLAQLAVVPKHIDPISTNPVYGRAFTKIGLMSIGLGVISLLLLPYIKKLIAKTTVNNNGT